MKSDIILSKLKSQVKLIESILTEGDHWPADYRRKAINRIRLATDALKYPDADIERDVDKMMGKFKEKLLHKNSNAGYFLPIIRMFIDYAGNDENKRKEFVDTKFNKIVDTLSLISNDPSLELKFKDDIKQKWSLEDFEKHAAEIQAEIDKNDADSLASVTNSDSSEYDVIPIESYEELHGKFGGDKTGYKGQSEWCHTNGDSTYDSWTSNGTKQFFVLAKKGWENIQPPDPKTTNAFDDYGTSLIAILVAVDDYELLHATLRWNHVIDPSETVPKTNPDRAFLGWGDLSKTLGFNVKAVVEKDIKEYPIELKNKIEKVNKAVSDKLKTVKKIVKSTFTQAEKRFMTQLDIPDNVTSIGKSAFERCESLKSVTIGNSVKSISWGAFGFCRNLRSITIPDSVTSIEASAFWDCKRLKSITIPDSVTSIGPGAFSLCSSLTEFIVDSNNPNYKSVNGLLLSKDGKKLINGINGNAVIPDGVTSIGDWAFRDCYDLTHVTIPDSVTSIGHNAFFDCPELKNIIIPRSVTSLGFRAFDDCVGLTNVTFEGKTLDTVRSMPDYPWGIKNPEEVIRVTDASN